MLDIQTAQLAEAARTASNAQDGDAVRLWRQVAEQAGHDLATLKEAAGALLQLKAVADADHLLGEAIVRFPDDKDLLAEHARCAALANRPDEELARFKLFCSRVPQSVVAFIGAIRAARKLSRAEEAETLAAEALTRFPEHPRIAIEAAICAEALGNWTDAKIRWRRAESLGPLDGRGFYGLGLALVRDQEIDQGEAALWRGLAQFPKDLDIRVALAEAATARERWGEAVSIWRGLLEDYPQNQRLIDGLGVATWRYKVAVESGEAIAAEDEVRTADVGLSGDDSLRDFLMNFESLGEDCEFGLIQRHFGAEPLGLLRWCSTRPNTVLSGLRGGFAGLGDIANLQVDLGKPEIMVNEKSSGIRFHTFIQRSPSLDVPAFARRQARHLQYLRRIFLERLQDGGRIYVYKPLKPIADETLLQIHDELRRHGSTTLLVIQRGDAANPAGTLRRAGPSLFYGYIDKYGLDHGGTNWRISFDLWIDLCRRTADALAG